MRTRLAVIAALSLAALGASAARVAAQPAPRVRIGAGLLGITTGESGWGGGTVDADVPLHRLVGLAAQGDFTRDEVDGYFSRAEYKDHAIVGGVRVTRTTRIAPYAELLAGIHQSERRETPRPLAPASITSSASTERRAVLQTGGGLLLHVNDVFGVRLGGGLQFIPDFSPIGRFSVGGVINLGR